jgi:hypothetical protein
MSDEAVKRLVIAIFIRAIRDARKGHRDAIQWLEEGGIPIRELLREEEIENLSPAVAGGRLP